jgi:O-antigen ligase
MLAAARVAADYPWLGVGPGNFKYYNRDYAKIGGFRAQAEDRKAHCLYLEIAAEHGVAGFICFLAIIGLTLRNLASTRRHWMHTHPEIANTATGFILAIAAYLITGLFLHLSYIRYFWLMLALAAATNYVASQISSPAAEGTSRPRRFSLA